MIPKNTSQLYVKKKDVTHVQDLSSKTPMSTRKRAGICLGQFVNMPNSALKSLTTVPTTLYTETSCTTPLLVVCRNDARDSFKGLR
mmetsp:Transcript_64742/g.171365  ORF Transcript_64742/g.171365 Transcript_64742/m.171365 type:complete len:86 (+) Transcript_64742:76-333(+)